MAIINEQTDVDLKRADDYVPIDITLAVADTSEPVLTVPSGKRVRALSLLNRSLETAFVSFSGTATTGDIELRRLRQLALDNVDFAAISFIGDTGDTPRLTGYVLLGDE